MENELAKRVNLEIEELENKYPGIYFPTVNGDRLWVTYNSYGEQNRYQFYSALILEPRRDGDPPVCFTTSLRADFDKEAAKEYLDRIGQCAEFMLALPEMPDEIRAFYLEVKKDLRPNKNGDKLNEMMLAFLKSIAGYESLKLAGNPLAA